MQVWRICKQDHIKTSFSGIGGLKGSARWHHRGHLIVYTSASLSLASLEIWVHVDARQPIPSYISVSANIPDDLSIERLPLAALPDDWRGREGRDFSVTRKLGTDWLIRRSSAVLQVPSAVIPGEFNYLLNPKHPDFPKIQQGQPAPFKHDARMWKKEGPSI
jgi:RES domain-containing protein